MRSVSMWLVVLLLAGLNIYSNQLLSMPTPSPKKNTANQQTPINKQPEFLTPQERERRRDLQELAVRTVQHLGPKNRKNNGRPWYALHSAQTAEEVRELLCLSYDPREENDEGLTAFHTAANIQVLEALSSYSFWFTLPARNGQTVLHTARTGHIAQLLLAKYKLSWNAVDHNNNTPFHTARDHTITQALYAYLLQQKIVENLAFLNGLKNNQGNTALHEANTPQQAEFLITHGMSTGVTNTKGDTPLHKAKSAAIARILIHHGAQPDYKNGEGHTALTRAVALYGQPGLPEESQNRYSELIRYLITLSSSSSTGLTDSTCSHDLEVLTETNSNSSLLLPNLGRVHANHSDAHKQDEMETLLATIKKISPRSPEECVRCLSQTR